MRGARCALKANEEVRSFRRFKTLMHELYKSGDERKERMTRRERGDSQGSQNEEVDIKIDGERASEKRRSEAMNAMVAVSAVGATIAVIALPRGAEEWIMTYAQATGAKAMTLRYERVESK